MAPSATITASLAPGRCHLLPVTEAALRLRTPGRACSPGSSQNCCEQVCPCLFQTLRRPSSCVQSEGQSPHRSKAPPSAHVPHLPDLCPLTPSAMLASSFTHTPGGLLACCPLCLECSSPDPHQLPPHHLQISTQMSPPQQGPSPPAHFKYHSLAPALPVPVIFLYLSTGLYTHTHTHTFLALLCNMGSCCVSIRIEPTDAALETRVLATGPLREFLSTGLNTADWTTLPLSMFTSWLPLISSDKGGDSLPAYAQPDP